MVLVRFCVPSLPQLEHALHFVQGFITQSFGGNGIQHFASSFLCGHTTFLSLLFPPVIVRVRDFWPQFPGLAAHLVQAPHAEIVALQSHMRNLHGLAPSSDGHT